MNIAHFHLPGLFEFYEFYKIFLPLFFENREFFYEWADIASIYGAPEECIWSGGRFESSNVDARNVLELLYEYKISARLTFSNSKLKAEHLDDKACNKLCKLFESKNDTNNGIIIYSDLLLDYIRDNYPGYYFVSSTTKVLTRYEELYEEICRKDFSYVVPDFRFNKQFELLDMLTKEEKYKIEFLCNECCDVGCIDRKKCYENVSSRIIGEDCAEHICTSQDSKGGYIFSKAMNNPMFISVNDIKNVYLPKGFSNFKIEGRGLGSALLLEMLIYYLVKPEYQIQVRENVYLDSMLNLF